MQKYTASAMTVGTSCAQMAPSWGKHEDIIMIVLSSKLNIWRSKFEEAERVIESDYHLPDRFVKSPMSHTTRNVMEMPSALPVL